MISLGRATLGAHHMPRCRIALQAAIVTVALFAASWADASDQLLELKPGLTVTVTTCQKNPPCPSFKSIAIGNPSVAFPSVINFTTVAVTGKMIGTTNLILFDEAGKHLFETAIQVVSGTDLSDDDNPAPRREVKTYSGVRETRTYFCAQNCSQEPLQREERERTGRAPVPGEQPIAIPRTNPEIVIAP